MVQLLLRVILVLYHDYSHHALDYRAYPPLETVVYYLWTDILQFVESFYKVFDRHSGRSANWPFDDRLTVSCIMITAVIRIHANFKLWSVVKSSSIALIIAISVYDAISYLTRQWNKVSVDSVEPTNAIPYCTDHANAIGGVNAILP